MRFWKHHDAGATDDEARLLVAEVWQIYEEEVLQSGATRLVYR